MNDLKFNWDEGKNSSNQRKHGISFEEAKTIFFDEDAIEYFDPAHSKEEDRFILLGLSFNLRVLVVCYCHRASHSAIRIISARKATRNESKAYRRNKS